PRDARIGNWYWSIGRMRLLQSRTDEAIYWFEQTCSTNPGLPYAHAHLASAYALGGQTARAAAELAEARRLSSSDCYSSIECLRAAQSWGASAPMVRALHEATYVAGLRKAGVPER